jgi:hypothetical protein
MNNVYRILRTAAKFLAGCVLVFVASWVLLSIFPPQYHYQPWIIGTAEPQGNLDEIITITANTGQNTFTQRKYAGQIMIRIRDPQLQVPPTPEGTVGAIEVKDLPFSFENFWIDDIRLTTSEFLVGQHGFGAFGIPYYHPVYGYQMLYTVGDKLRAIAFRMENPKIPNTKSFEILISIENRFCCFGR